MKTSPIGEHLRPGAVFCCQFNTIPKIWVEEPIPSRLACANNNDGEFPGWYVNKYKPGFYLVGAISVDSSSNFDINEYQIMILVQKNIIYKKAHTSELIYLKNGLEESSNSAPRSFYKFNWSKDIYLPPSKQINKYQKSNTYSSLIKD